MLNLIHVENEDGHVVDKFYAEITNNSKGYRQAKYKGSFFSVRANSPGLPPFIKVSRRRIGDLEHVKEAV